MDNTDLLRELNDRAFELVQAREHGSEAIEVNVRILELDPEDLPARTRLGYAYRLAGDFDSAETIYEEILERSGSGGSAETARQALGQIQHEREHGRLKSMDEMLGEVVNANDARIRAAAARQAGRLSQALRWSDRSLELAECQGRAALKRALATRASIERQLGSHTEAVRTAQRCVEINDVYEDNGPAYRTLTASLLDLGNVDDAVAVTEQYLEPDRESPHAQNTAGRALFGAFRVTGEVDQLERSAKCFKQAAELGSGSTDALATLGKIHAALRRAGRPEQADDLAAFFLRIGSPIPAT